MDTATLFTVWCLLKIERKRRLAADKLLRWSRANPQKCRDRSRRYYEANSQKLRDRARRYYEADPQKYRGRTRQYREVNPQKCRNSMRQWSRANPQKVRDIKHRWREAHRPQIAARCRERRKNNPGYRIRCNLSRRARQALHGTDKAASTLALIGCSREALRAHLESQFQPGMSWENYGPRGWHIDHIKPCSKFDLTDPAQQKICFNWRNLQPLWADENIHKSNKWEGSCSA